MTDKEKELSDIEKKPPFFKSWKSVYIMVLSVLVVLILLFFWFTVSFS